MLKQKPTQASTRGALAQALGALSRAGGPPDAEGVGVPCWGAGGGAWTSEAPVDRAEAAKACQPCPVLELCRAAGRYESFGVWGGQDREAARRVKRPALAPAVLLALATAPTAHSTPAALAEDVNALLGTVERPALIAASLTGLGARGMAVNHAPHGQPGLWQITAAGFDAAEGVGASASRDTSAILSPPEEAGTHST